ncbi:glycosyltransferase family 39 protein [Virgibacillus sp. JSM 102003]|uniref:glycosyltransferase family 39 protein n=1 Tax=Virgibacillus sp. JSM 102003 TaxID=1562108 RepID=UPI0035C10F4A
MNLQHILPTFNKKHIPIILIIIFSLCLHLLFLIVNPADPTPRDAGKYEKMAFQIINESIYGYNSEKPNAYVTPSHPFYLVVVFKISEWVNLNHETLTQIVNMVLSIGTILLAYLIPKRLFKKELIALLSALLLATYISPLHYFRTFLTETPATFMFYLSIFIFIIALEKKKYRWHILFGILASLMIMWRSSPAPLLLFAAIIVFIKVGFKQAIQIGLLWCIGPLLIILPWVIRNFGIYGKAHVFSNHAGNPMLAGTNPYYLEDFQKDIMSVVRERDIPQKEYAIMRIKEGFKTQFELYFSWFTLGKTMWLFNSPANISTYNSVIDPAIRKLMYIHHFFIVLGGFLTGFLALKHKRALCIFLVLLGYIAISNMFLPTTRYGFVAIPLLCILVSYGVVTFIEFLLGLIKRKKVTPTS